MPVVLLVRHGQASFGADDYDHLSDLGREQSTAVGQVLAARGLRDPVVVSGTLRRQRDTAALALAAAGLEVESQVDPRWDEYDLLGLTGRYLPPEEAQHDGTTRGLQVLLDRALKLWIADADGGGWQAFSEGARDAVAELTGGLRKGQDGVVFTSGGVIATVCAGLLGLGADGVIALNRVAANGAITKLIVGSAGTHLSSFNDHSHFEGPMKAMLSYR